MKTEDEYDKEILDSSLLLNKVMKYILAFVIFAWGITWFLDKSGEFGDKFGVVTSLFSGLAFVGLIYAIGLQIQEIKLQKIELQKNRDEMKINNAELKEQNEAMKVQNFNGAFYNEISNYSQSINNLAFRHGNIDFKGVKALEAIGQLPREITKSSYIAENLIHIIVMVMKSNIEDKSFYYNSIFSRLSAPESTLLKNKISKIPDLKQIFDEYN